MPGASAPLGPARCGASGKHPCCLGWLEASAILPTQGARAMPPTSALPGNWESSAPALGLPGMAWHGTAWHGCRQPRHPRVLFPWVPVLHCGWTLARARQLSRSSPACQTQAQGLCPCRGVDRHPPPPCTARSRGKPAPNHPLLGWGCALTREDAELFQTPASFGVSPAASPGWCRATDLSPRPAVVSAAARQLRDLLCPNHPQGPDPRDGSPSHPSPPRNRAGLSQPVSTTHVPTWAFRCQGMPAEHPN